MLRLLTKKSREEARQSWIGDKITEKYLDIEILRKDKPNNMSGYLGLTVWRGSAGNPYLNYSYKTVEQRELAVKREKESAERREKYNQENSDNRRKELTQAAKASHKIKEILKKEYPTIKFSVYSDNYANGSSVHVSWYDGVPQKAIEGFLNQFQYGHFDGMTDCYEMSNVNEKIPQAKFVFGDREVSKEKQAIIQEQLAKLMNIENQSYAVIPKNYMINVRGYAFDAPLSALVYQISVDYDFTKGFTGVRYKKQDGEDITNVFELY